MSNYIKKIGIKSKIAFQKSLNTNFNKKNLVLENFNSLIRKEKNLILKKNNEDLILAKKNRLKENFVDRLFLDAKRIENIRHSINEIIKLKDPIGKIVSSWKRPNGMLIQKVSIPIGVIGIIFESRPNVVCDVSSLCFKSGNAAILRGGSESINSNKILADLFQDSLVKKGYDKNCIQLIENQNKKLVNFLLKNMTNYIDLIIPRGGKKLVKKVQSYSKVPILGHLEGICHIYIHEDADLKKSINVVLNSKLRRTTNCGALETLLINEKILKKFCEPILNSLINKNCKIIGDDKIIKNFSGKIKLAKEKDWKTEYLAPIISIKAVKNLEEAISHINKFGTMHTDSIITKNIKVAKKFLNGVNSAIAMHNVSTQFADGGEFGFGAEVGISTSKLHARGPVGLNQLTTYKYFIKGNGQIRD